jgi:hypothetical protein
MPNDFRVSITDAPEERAYPISSFTWLLVPAEFSDKSKLKAMKDFLQWMSTDGQKLTEQLQYATLPSQIVGPMDLWHINTRLCFTLGNGKSVTLRIIWHKILLDIWHSDEAFGRPSQIGL